MTHTNVVPAVRLEIANLLLDLADAADKSEGKYLQGSIAFVTDVIPVPDLKAALRKVAEELKAND